jgi:hypothetical protein
MKTLLTISVFFILMFGCIKPKDDTTPPPTVKPKVTLMLANQINVNNHKQQMIKISVRYDGSSGLHNWNDLALSEGYQAASGLPTYHNAGLLPLDEYGAHAVQVFFADGGTAYWEQFSFTQDKATYLHAWTNSNGNAAFVELDGIPAKTISGF